jgi:hypothetical protein
MSTYRMSTHGVNHDAMRTTACDRSSWQPVQGD